VSHRCLGSYEYKRLVVDVRILFIAAALKRTFTLANELADYRRGVKFLWN